MIESDTIEQVRNVYKNCKNFKIFQIAFSDERTNQGRTDGQRDPHVWMRGRI